MANGRIVFRTPAKGKFPLQIVQIVLGGPLRLLFND